jgi:SpoVK/Ycf46/Vps4 family AAA+-type ATPase
MPRHGLCWAEGAVVRIVLVTVCLLGISSASFPSLVRFAAAAAETDKLAEILYVRGCREPTSADARETMGCFASASAGQGGATLPKSVVLSLQGVNLPTDLYDHRVLLQEYRRPSLLGEEPSETAGADGGEGDTRGRLPIAMLCERPSVSELFPSQLITCELVNPLLTMNTSDVWLPRLKRLLDKTVWFDVRLEVKRGDANDYRAVSVLRRAVQLQVRNISQTDNNTDETAQKRQHRAVSWEEVRQHPLERLYSPISASEVNATASKGKASAEQGDNGLFEDADALQHGERVWVELGIGGLKRELRSLFRRVFLSRLPSLAPLAEALELQHVRGVILYGPPGNGKTLIARNLFRLLGPNTRLSVVNAADILSKFVGESEKNLRDVFEGYDIGTSSKAEDAEKSGEKTAADKTASKGKAAKAGTLQVLVIDEFEALFRRRGHSGDESSAKAVYDGVTNTLLSLMDGVKSRNDLLVVGLTNRLQAIDQALLRPGRFEVLLEIPAPDVPGREDIFFIHTDRLRAHHFIAPDVDLHTLALESGGFSGSDIAGTVRSAVSYALLRYRKDGLFANLSSGAPQKEATKTRMKEQTTHGVAAASNEPAEEYGHRPGDMGGAGGLSQLDNGRDHNDEARESASASSSPFSFDTTSFQVTRADFERAMKDIRSAKDEASALSQLSTDGDGAAADVIDFDGTVKSNVERATAVMSRVMQSDRTTTGLIAITGAPGTGKSTIARTLTRVQDFTTVRFFSCRRLTELRDREEQLAKLRDALSEASHTERGLVVLDDYDVLVDSIGGGGGYAAMTLRGLLYEYMHRPGGVSRALVADSPLAAAEDAGGEAEAGSVVVNAGSRVSADRNRRVLVLTSTLSSVLQPLSFDVHLRVHPVLRRGAATLLTEYRVVDAAHAPAVAAAYPVSMSFRTFLRVTDMSLQRWIQQLPTTTTATADGVKLQDVKAKQPGGEQGATTATKGDVQLPAYFATSEAMRSTYDELHAEQKVANFYTVTTDEGYRSFVASVRAITANMRLTDPYEGWNGNGDEDEEKNDADEEDGDDVDGEPESTMDLDTVVGAADELLW